MAWFGKLGKIGKFPSSAWILAKFSYKSSKHVMNQKIMPAMYFLTKAFLLGQTIFAFGFVQLKVDYLPHTKEKFLLYSFQVERSKSADQPLWAQRRQADYLFHWGKATDILFVGLHFTSGNLKCGDWEKNWTWVNFHLLNKLTSVKS